MKQNDKQVILLVDDKPANILVLENLLAADDRLLLKASSGEEALKIALKETIDLIILDVQMPDMDGFEVAQTLKLKKDTRNIPIIFATAESKERKFVMKGYDEGAIDYLLKPLDPGIVKAKVNVLLKIQQQQKELLEKNISLQNSALLINNSPDIIGIIDEATLIIEEMNQAVKNILGYEPEEMEGKSMLSFLEPGEAGMLDKLAKAKKERLSFETHIHCKDKSRKWLQWNIVVSKGKWFVNVRDVSEQKQSGEKIKQLNAELKNNVQQLEITNKELESFSYSVSHDLRAPLRALSGYSKMIEEDYGPQLDKEARRLLDNIQSGAARMNNLIDDLLALSRLGRKELRKDPCTDMNKIVANVLDEINKSSQYKADVKINPLHPADADKALMHQVWLNLVSNAIKYSSKKENPQVTIGSEESEDVIVYFVKDNGAGFDMEYAGKLFGVFQRLHKASDFEGTGVGLAIVQRIITRHGGSVWAEGKKEEGATFYFTLPVKTEK